MELSSGVSTCCDWFRWFSYSGASRAPGLVLIPSVGIRNAAVHLSIRACEKSTTPTSVCLLFAQQLAAELFSHLRYQ